MTQKITAIFGIAVMAAILLGGLTFSQSAFAGQSVVLCEAPTLPVPSIEPFEIRETLSPGDLIDIDKSIIPNNNECFRFIQIDSVDFNCSAEFLENLGVVVDFGFPDEPTRVDERVFAFSDAEPEEYHCDVIFTLEYGEDFNALQSISIDVTQSIWITVPEPEEPRTIGFWKNHQEQTEEHLPMFIGGYGVVTFDDATDVFNANAKNAHDMLAAQLLAAEINVWNNVSSCQEVDDAIEAANGTLGVANYEGPGSTDAPKKSDKDEVNAIKDILNQFNNFGCS